MRLGRMSTHVHKDFNLPDPHDAGYESLANAIILCAVSDLRLALSAEGQAAREMKQDCLDFLLSGLADRLTSADLSVIVKKILKE